jgi:hypothetical protein
MAEGLERDQSIPLRDGDGGGGKCLGGNCVVQNRERGRKEFVLIFESGDESGWRTVQGFDAREKFVT